MNNTKYLIFFHHITFQLTIWIFSSNFIKTAFLEFIENKYLIGRDEQFLNRAENLLNTFLGTNQSILYLIFYSFV
mgnify:CR=1 FL=1